MNKRYTDLSADEYVMVQEYKDVFGTADYKSMLLNFGVHYEDVTELPWKRKAKCLSMMREQLNTHNAKKSRLSTNERRVMTKDQQHVERVWVTATGREIPISRMDDDHLNNTILFIDRRLAEGQWQIGRNKDPKDLLIEMEAERVRRNMPLPLLSIKSLAFRKGELK